MRAVLHRLGTLFIWSGIFFLGLMIVVRMTRPSPANVPIIGVTLVICWVMLNLEVTRHLAKCPRCRSRGVRRFALDRRFGRCPTCGQYLDRRGGVHWKEVSASALPEKCRKKLDRPLRPDALQPVVDATTCGSLLSSKQGIDLATLVHRVERGSRPDRTGKDVVEPIAEPGETSCDRLLRIKRHRDGQDMPARSPSGSLWDRWVDGGS